MQANCIKRHRALKRPESIAKGMGPVCARRGNDQEQSAKEQQYDGGDVVCRRTARGVETNIPHSWKYHSLTGFEWGYAGSGPAEFALNILVQFLPKDMAFRRHQDFKRRFIEPLPRKGGTIKVDDINRWIVNNCQSREVVKCRG